MVLSCRDAVAGWSRGRRPTAGDDPVRGLVGSDLLAAFVARRVLPLQSRPHLICQMSGQLDPSRMCTKDMPHDEVAHMVNYLANCKLSAE